MHDPFNKEPSQEVEQDQLAERSDDQGTIHPITNEELENIVGGTLVGNVVGVLVGQVSIASHIIGGRAADYIAPKLKPLGRAVGLLPPKDQGKKG